MKMKPTDVNSITYIDIDVECNNKDPKFEVVDHVRIKFFFSKDYNPNSSEEDFMMKKVKNTVPRIYVISDLNGEEIVGTSYEK